MLFTGIKERIKMKNLATCTPTEFIKQTVKIRKTVVDWFDKTKVLEIRQTQPALVDFLPNMTKAEKEEVRAENVKRQNEQAKKNLLKMFDMAFEEYPEKTLEVLAAVCFTDFADVDTHTMSEYFGSLNEMINDENVIGFFTSLVRLANGNI